MLNRFTLTSVLILLILSATPKISWAAKPFKPKAAATAKKTSGNLVGTIPVSVKMRADKQAVLFSFPTFSGWESVSYSFTYDANGIPQGAGGTITEGNNPGQVRELFFGTCSTSVCTTHRNIRNARLVFSAKRTNGNTSTRSFRIKTNL